METSTNCKSKPGSLMEKLSQSLLIYGVCDHSMWCTVAVKRRGPNPPQIGHHEITKRKLASMGLIECSRAIRSANRGQFGGVK